MNYRVDDLFDTTETIDGKTITAVKAAISDEIKDNLADFCNFQWSTEGLLTQIGGVYFAVKVVAKKPEFDGQEAINEYNEKLAEAEEKARKKAEKAARKAAKTEAVEKE